MSIDTPTPDELQKELSMGAETKLEKPAPKSPETQDNELEAEVFGTVDQYTANEAQKKQVSESVQRAVKMRQEEADERAKLREQVGNGQDMVRFRNQSWRPRKEEGGNILLSSALADEESSAKARTLIRVETDENFKGSLEKKRQKLESLWTENKKIEQKVGGAENLAEIQKTVGEIKKVEEQLAQGNILKESMKRAQNDLQRIEGYVIEGAKADPETKGHSQRIKENDRARFTKELLGAEEQFRKFIQTKPELLAKKDGLFQELRRLASNKR